MSFITGFVHLYETTNTEGGENKKQRAISARKPTSNKGTYIYLKISRRKNYV